MTVKTIPRREKIMMRKNQPPGKKRMRDEQKTILNLYQSILFPGFWKMA